MHKMVLVDHTPNENFDQVCFMVKITQINVMKIKTFFSELERKDKTLQISLVALLFFH